MFLPSDIDASLCTHIIYSFAILNPTSLEMVVADTELDIDQGFYRQVKNCIHFINLHTFLSSFCKLHHFQVTDLKSQGVKVSIALGGWGDSAGDKYSRMVNSASARANFVTKAVEFLQRFV